MAPFDRSSTSFYSRFLVAMALSCIVSEIKQDISRKSQYFHTSHVFDATVKRGGGRRTMVGIFGDKNAKCECFSLQRGAKILTNNSIL